MLDLPVSTDEVNYFNLRVVCKVDLLGRLWVAFSLFRTIVDLRNG